MKPPWIRPSFPIWSHLHFQSYLSASPDLILPNAMKSVSVRRLVVSNPLIPWTVAHLCPWDSLGKNTGVGSNSLLQGIFLTKGSNKGLLHCRQILYHLSNQGSPPKSMLNLKHYPVSFASGKFANTILSNSAFSLFPTPAEILLILAHFSGSSFCLTFLLSPIWI